jgi:hypothetical protein
MQSDPLGTVGVRQSFRQLVSHAHPQAGATMGYRPRSVTGEGDEYWVPPRCIYARSWGHHGEWPESITKGCKPPHCAQVERSVHATSQGQMPRWV